MTQASPPAAPVMPSEEEIARAIYDAPLRLTDDPFAVLIHESEWISDATPLREQLEQVRDICRDAARAVLSLIRPAFEAKDAEIAEWQREAVGARSKLRWNIDDEGRLVRLCDGEHDKGERCEFTTYVPEQDLLAAEAKLAQAVEALGPFAEVAKRYDSAEHVRRQPSIMDYTGPLTIDDFRRARTADSDIQGEKN